MNKLLPILFLVLTTFSRTVYREFAIDVYKPGLISLPSDVKNIAILSRNFKFDNDTLQHYYKSGYILRKDKKNAHLNIDSIAVSNALQGLASGLEGNGAFEKVKLFPYGLIKPHRGERMAPFSNSLIRELSDLAQADILISLEAFSYFYSEYNLPDFETPGNEVITVGIWSIIDPAEMKIIERKSMVDTVFWDGYGEGADNKRYKLPPRITSIKLAAEIAGGNYAKRLTPSWHKVSRMYVIPPVEDFRLAAAYLEQEKWGDAIRYWEKYTQKKYGKLAINASYNLALAYEMKDEFEKAQEWITYAYQIALALKSGDDLKMIILYKNILDKRQEELDSLNQSD